MRNPADFILTALITVSLMSASPCPADPAGGSQTAKSRTLSLQTSEGMVVITRENSDIARISEMLREETSPPAANRDLFLWLVERNVPAESIRMYVMEKSLQESDSGLPDLKWKHTTVGEAVLAGEIPDISDKEIYEAYMIIRATGAEVYLDENSVPRFGGTGMLPHTVFVLSSGYLNGYHGIFVDGTNYSESSSSYNVVAFTPDGAEVAVSEGFNMFESPQAGKDMAQFLNSLPGDTIILASIKSGPGVFLSRDAVSALGAYGSSVSLDPEVLSSHAMIGKKGWPPGSALEKTAVNMGSRVIYFEDRLYVDASRAEEVISVAGGRCFVLSGTGPNSPVLIFGGM